MEQVAYKDKPAGTPIDFSALPPKEAPYTCADFANAKQWDLSFCCDSCHEDEGYGYYLCEPETPDGHLCSVCCRLWEEIEGAVKPPR